MAESVKEEAKVIQRSTSSTAKDVPVIKSNLSKESSRVPSIRQDATRLDERFEPEPEEEIPEGLNEIEPDGLDERSEPEPEEEIPEGLNEIEPDGFGVPVSGLESSSEEWMLAGLDPEVDSELEPEEQISEGSLPFQVTGKELLTEPRLRHFEGEGEPQRIEEEDEQEEEEEENFEEEEEEDEQQHEEKFEQEEEEEDDVTDRELSLTVALQSQRCVYNLYRQGELYDLVVKVEDKEFKCHRIILAAMSGYFHTMLLSEMKESTEGSVTLKTISAKTFARVLRLIYGGIDVVASSGSVENLLRAATYLQIKVLEKQCVKFLDHNMDVKNVIGIWSLSQTHNLRPLKDKAWDLIISRFSDVSRFDEIVVLPEEELIQILKDDDLTISSEDIICNAVLKWIKHDLPARESRLPVLFQFVCLPKVTGPYLFDTLFQDDLMKTNSTFKELVQEALCFHLKQDQRDEIMARQTTLRSMPDIQKVVLLIGGFVIQDQMLQSVVCYDLRQQKWYTLASVPHDLGVDFASCCMKNEVYVSGGSRSMDKFVKFCPVQNTWYLQPSLITGRECHAMVAVNETLYVLGGSSSALQKSTKLPTAVEGYDTKSGRWFVAGHLQVPMESLSATTLHETIFTFGGIGDDRKPSSVIQSFHTGLGTSMVYGCLPHPVGHTVAITLNSTIYIICPDGDVLNFAVGDKEVSRIVQIANMNRTGFGVYVHKCKLVVIGGESVGFSLSDRIIAVDLEKRMSKVLYETLPIPMAMFHMETINLPKRLLLQEGFNIMPQALNSFE